MVEKIKIMGFNYFLDGVDITKIDPQAYRSHIGLVSQEPALFGLSIAQNIGNLPFQEQFLT